ncbi:MAG: hypothetical protein M1830_003058, partial [Pleopsidium flavum]
MSLIPWTPSSYPPLTSKTIPFLLHILLELPASILFFLRPSTQLPHPHPPSHALIRQYAILLLSSNLIAFVFLVYRVEGGGGGGAGGAGGGVGGVHQKEEEIGTGLKDVRPLVA